MVVAATASDNGGDAHLPSLLSSLPPRSDQKQEATVAAATIRDGGGNAPPSPREILLEEGTDGGG